MSEMPTSCLSCCAAPQLPEERTTKSEATGLLVERPTLYDLNPLSLAYWRLMLVRLWGTIQVTVTKLFFAGMGWQVGATIASNSGAYSKSLSYALLSGLGVLLYCVGIPLALLLAACTGSAARALRVRAPAAGATVPTYGASAGGFGSAPRGWNSWGLQAN